MRHFFDRDYAFKIPTKPMAVAMPFYKLGAMQKVRSKKMKISNECKDLINRLPAAKRAANRLDINPDEFLSGQRDCQNGVPHKADRSRSYDRGYSTQYELNAYKDEVTKNGPC